ncbi:MAG: ABC-type transport system substrate-binding protein [Glaciecola sp.]|jgi:ABC-type transport system substrate-binding protein
MRHIGTILSLALITISIFSCVKKRDLKNNVVVVRISSTPAGLHPVNGNSSTHSFIFAYTQNRLISTNLITEKIEPQLIVNLPAVDSTGLLYKYQLKEDIYWSDKTPFTVDDVIFTAKISLCPLSNNPDIRPILSSVIDSIFPVPNEKHSFYLKAKTKHVLNSQIFLENLYMQQKMHWDKDGLLDQLFFKNIHASEFKSSIAMDEWFNEFNNSDNSYLPERLVGLGPYQVESFKKDNFISLIRKKDWWGDNFEGHQYDNFPEKIIFKVIKDNAAVYLAIKNQEIDFTHSAGGTSKLMKLQKLDYFNENYNSDFISGYSYSYMGLNMRPNLDKQTPFFTDKRVRRAMAHLVPVQEIIDLITYGKAERQASIVSPLKSSCDSTLKFIALDIEKAKELLKDAGWEDSDNDQIVDKILSGRKENLSFKLNYISSAGTKEIVFMIKESMKKAGVELIANPLDFNSLYQKASNHEFDAMLGGWLSDSKYSDPTQLWGTESWSNKGSNFCGFGNSYSDSLIIKSNTSLDPEKHLLAYRKLQKLIYDEQPYIFLWSGKMPIVAHKRFTGTEFFRAKPNVSLGSFKLKI